jgi:hypothetical protein
LLLGYGLKLKNPRLADHFVVPAAQGMECAWWCEQLSRWQESLRGRFLAGVEWPALKVKPLMDADERQ